ncbi:hypothetical protein F5146DRAFT_1142317 [Armillaria mellea]|nr:hypothetical protein F5146DRAFT_1142317 [Armillaria mellea]
MSTAVAGWKITIYAGGLSPGVIEPQNLFSSVGVNVGGQSWADFDKGCDRHVDEPRLPWQWQNQTQAEYGE